MKNNKFSLGFIGFLQSLGLFSYCSLVGLLFWKGNEWFGKVPNFWGPLLFLSLFVVSSLICALLALGYPIFLFWEKKKKAEALRLVGWTALWLVLFVLLIMGVILAGR